MIWIGIVALVVFSVAMIGFGLSMLGEDDAEGLVPLMVGLFGLIAVSLLVYDEGKHAGVVAHASGKAKAERIDHGDTIEWKVEYTQEAKP